MFLLNICSTSGAGMPRNSIMSGFGGTEKMKDARPLHDKSFVQQCIRQLHEVKTLLPTFCLNCLTPLESRNLLSRKAADRQY